VVDRRRRRRRSGVETTFFSYNGVHEKRKPSKQGVKGDDPLASLGQSPSLSFLFGRGGMSLMASG
jgi:hypothetical protein